MVKKGKTVKNQNDKVRHINNILEVKKQVDD